MYIAQQIAAHAITQVLAGRNLTTALPAALAEFPRATPQQRGATADLSYGTLRFLGEINAYLSELLSKPVTDVFVQSLLQVACYQLLHDEKSQAFTIVNQAVKATEFAKKSWAKGLVNAVLRNLLRQKSVIEKKIAQNDVAQFSYPKWWISKLQTQYPEYWQSILRIGNQHPPMTLRVNIRKKQPDDYLAELQQQGIQAKRIGDTAIMLEQPLPVENIPGFYDGEVSVQDYGAQFAAKLLSPARGMRVLDACCAPGGKTGHILEYIDVPLTAIDSDTSRLEKVTSNLVRLGLHANLLTGDAGEPQSWWDGQAFDRILADVPCTASGIVRRHVDIKWLRREEDLTSFATQQAKILSSLWQLLKPGGQLLYVTCSIFAEENQMQITRFLAAHPEATQLPVELAEANLSHQQGQLIPSNLHDGFFYALLQKR